jgi:ribokinase
MSPLKPLKFDLLPHHYQALIGTGGIGSGSFFALNGNHTLGREESRTGRFLDQRDYCKLHIITHYVATLIPKPFRTIPLGMVGEDELGLQLLDEMRNVGMELGHVKVCPGERTLLSICFLYPDGSGGNLTPDHSACQRVDERFISDAENVFIGLAGRGVALAAPEVPLEARQKLLSYASHYNFYRVASFTSGELREAIVKSMLTQIDLLSINIDEAAALLGWDASTRSLEEIIQGCFARLSLINPSIQVTITCGGRGSWGWDGKRIHYLRALPVQVANTAGAGDAFLAGMIIACVAGLGFRQTQQLATLIAGYSTTSLHTIHPDLDRNSLRTFSLQKNLPLSAEINRLLEE